LFLFLRARVKKGRFRSSPTICFYSFL